MKIDSVDAFYLAMPEVRDIGDGSQDALLIRVRAGGFEGWGECEAAPLVSIASLVCPMSHSACKPVLDSVLGQRLDSPADIARIGAQVRANSFDLLQADHTLSGIDIACWDLLGRRYEQPVHELLGYQAATPKRPYASVLFGAVPRQTWQTAREIAAAGFTAAKFGWAGFGAGTLAADVAQLAAARDGLGPDVALLVDAGMAFGHDAAAAAERLPALGRLGAEFLEEPFVPGAEASYRELAARCGPIGLAGGEGCHTADQAIAMVEHCGLRYVQVDAGRVGGITAAKQVADHAAARGVRYVNHTFTSHLALSASLQPYAGHPAGGLCEYPIAPAPLAAELTTGHLVRDADGLLRLPAAPGLGIEVAPAALATYRVEVEIAVGGRVLYQSPVA